MASAEKQSAGAYLGDSDFQERVSVHWQGGMRRG